MRANVYSQLMIDPPWLKRKGGLRKVRPRQGRTLDYPTMPTEEIFELLDREIFPLAAPTHNIFLWTIDAFLIEAERAMSERGYKRHARLIWDKTNGVAPAFTVRFSHEYLIWFYKPKLRPICQSQRGKWPTVLREPAREHSRKPDIAYQFVNTLYPEERCLDVFSREAREGWDQWGNEVDFF